MNQIFNKIAGSKRNTYRSIFLFSLVVGFTALLSIPAFSAEIYEWVDENGVKRYSDTPPANARDVKVVEEGLQKTASL